MHALRIRRRDAGLLTLAALVLPGCATRPPAGHTAPPALHALQRLGYGPAPGDVERVEHLGVDAWIAAQLQPPASPALPPGVQQALATPPPPTQGEWVRIYRSLQGNESEATIERRRETYRASALDAARPRLLRALHSPAQLEERMVEFWFDHFNVFREKGLVRVMVEDYERTAIRPHAMGRFRDLLGATAHHPAMLFYLDNWLSSAPGLRPRGQPERGLNENYARELMELHTLGVDGGYTQADVTALARIFTGWTLRYNDTAPLGDAFFFDARRHDTAEKTWLGRRVTSAGQAEGEAALDVLARHPATARHIAFKLAQAFVADAPPPALVQRLALRFQDTDGDIRAVLQALFQSPEFGDPQFQQAKFKSPYRYLISALRAAGTPLDDAQPLLAATGAMGMPLHGCVTPDGYGNTEAAWLNPDALTRRVQFATGFATGRLPRGGGQGNLQLNAPDADTLLAALGDGISARTRAVASDARPELRAALVLGSPDFMRF